jgi:hypothetical protein
MIDRKRLFLATTLAVCLLAAGVPTLEASGVPKLPEGWTFSFPEGDPRDGKTVFMRMECYSCHTVSIPGEKLPDGTGGVGPALTPGYSKLPAAYLAEAIIKVHSVVAAPGYELKAGQAGMGKYNHFLTVQELVDLVAFLKRLPGSDAK